MLVKEETLAHVLTLQKPYSLLSLFLIGDCFEYGKRQEETDDKERTSARFQRNLGLLFRNNLSNPRALWVRTTTFAINLLERL
jgi:hypothetical protein